MVTGLLGRTARGAKKNRIVAGYTFTMLPKMGDTSKPRPIANIQDLQQNISQTYLSEVQDYTGQPSKH